KGGAIDTNHGFRVPRAPIVDHLCEQLLARARFTRNEHGRRSGGNVACKAHHMLKGQALPYQCVAVRREPQCLSKVDVFFDQLVSESIDLFVGLDMIDRIGDLRRDLRQELEILWLGSARLDTADVENTETRVFHEKGQIDHASEAFLQVPCVFKEDLFLRQVGTDVDSFMLIDPTHHASDSWNHRIAFQHHLRHRRSHDIKLEPIDLTIVLGDRCACPRNDLRDLGCQGFPQTVHVPLRIEHKGHSQEGSIVCFKPVHRHNSSYTGTSNYRAAFISRYPTRKLNAPI